MTNDDQSATRTAEPVFEVRIRPESCNVKDFRLMSGQRLIVRFEMPPRPLLVQWWRQLLQVIQQRRQSSGKDAGAGG